MHTNSNRSFSSYIIGNSSLCVRCAKILLDGGHDVQGVITSDPDVSNWARNNSISWLFLPADIEYSKKMVMDFLKDHSFDYLFSIDNPAILSTDILKLPQSFAVNYHDAPLPKYGGLNATTWAIFSQEKAYGVSWHIMDDKVDAGDILKQPKVQLSDVDTALTLNAKCYEFAISSFQELVDELENSRVVRKKQISHNRTFFSGHRQPSPACLLDWNLRADRLNSLVRSLDFGTYPNPIGLPKIFSEHKILVLKTLSPCNTKSISPPGTIMAIEDTHLVVSTFDMDVEVRNFESIYGQKLHVSEVVDRFGLRVGHQFSPLAQESVKSINSYNKETKRHELYWVKILSKLNFIQPPYFRKIYSTQESLGYENSSTRVPKSFGEYAQNQVGDLSFGEFVLCSFAIYLSRITGVSDFNIAISYPDLTRSTLAPIIQSLYSSYVPLHIEIDSGLTFREGLEELKKQIATCKYRKTFSLDTATRYPESRTNSYMLKTPTVLVEIVDDEKLLEIGNQSVNADLILRIPANESTNSFTIINWCCKRECCENEKLQDIQNQFFIMFQHGIEHPNQKICSLPLLSQSEYDRILVGFNQKGPDFPQHLLFHELFEVQAKRVPECKAVVFGDKYLTYRDLDHRSSQLAQILHEAGVRPESLVGIYIDRSLEMIIAILAVLKAGGAYVPLNLDDPKNRLATILEDTQLNIILTKTSLECRLPKLGLRIFRLDTILLEKSITETKRVDSLLKPDNLAYVLFTSGSTGEPKGVMMSHRALVNRFLWELDTFNRDETDTVLQQFSISFDYSVWEIFIALTSGACLVLAEPHSQMDSYNLSNLIKRQNVTIIGFVPTMLDSILNQKNLENIQSLRQISTGGEELTIELQKKYFEKLSIPLLNGYGPTEACIDATWWTCRPVPEHSDIPIGRPLANSSVYILDQNLQIVPIGIPGELYISGICLARGYLNRPELTAQSFIPDSFSSIPGARMYKTGDQARYLPDGNIVFLGRVDNQIKIRGFRVEPSEIENALCLHSAITQSIVLATEDNGQKQLTAYITLNDEGSPAISELWSWIRQRLPDYMNPSALMILKMIPLTPNGKVDRSALPAPTSRDRSVVNELVRPRDKVESQLTEIWEDALNFSPIGVNDNFFEMGGHSLLAEQIFVNIEREFRIRLPLATLFQAPTISSLSTMIREHSFTPS